MARRRKAGNGDLPAFVYFNGHSYTYKHPITGAVDGIGSERDLAIERGKLLNQRIFGNDARRLKALRRGQVSLEAMLDAFKEHRRARVSKVTFAGDAVRIEQYRRWFNTGPGLITIDQINRRLEGAGYDVIRQHKSLLRLFFEFCRSRGAIAPTAPNHARLVIVPPRAKKRRRRLTLEQFWQIHGRASVDLKAAMAISLITSMRRTDLVSLTAENCDKPRIRYIPSKTAENPNPMPTACKLSDQHWARYIAPVLLRASGGRLIPRSAEWLTREFGELSTAVTGLDGGLRPTLHEVRALSDDLYRRQGDDTDTIRQRNAHRSERTTEGYLAGHGVIYTDVACTLNLEPKP